MDPKRRTLLPSPSSPRTSALTVAEVATPPKPPALFCMLSQQKSAVYWLIETCTTKRQSGKTGATPPAGRQLHIEGERPAGCQVEAAKGRPQRCRVGSISSIYDQRSGVGALKNATEKQKKHKKAQKKKRELLCVNSFRSLAGIRTFLLDRIHENFNLLRGKIHHSIGSIPIPKLCNLLAKRSKKMTKRCQKTF